MPLHQTKRELEVGKVDEEEEAMEDAEGTDCEEEAMEDDDAVSNDRMDIEGCGYITYKYITFNIIIHMNYTTLCHLVQHC